MSAIRSRPDSLVDLLRDMIAIKTVNARASGEAGTEGELAGYLEAVAGRAGLETRRLPVPGDLDNLLIMHESDAAYPWLLFVSHMDTVAVEGMTVDPFGGEIRDGRIHGRGACDTKATGAAALWSLMDYTESADQPNNLAILFSVDEEVGMTGAMHFVSHDLPRLGWTPTGVVIGEPTDLRPVTAHNGVMRWRIHTEGVSAHSSEPSAGRSAISMMVEVVRAIESRYIAKLEASHPLTGLAQCSINVIRGGTQVNIIPDHCEIDLDRRTVPGEEAGQVLPTVEKVLDELRRTNADLKVRQDEAFIVPALDPETNEAWSSYVRGALDRLGLPSDPVGAKYGTEASSFGQAGIAAVVLGPGSVAQAHTKDEWLEIDQLELASKVYLEIMRTRLPMPG